MLDLHIPYESLRYLAVFTGLFVTACFYNYAVTWLEKKHYQEGWLALLVVIGVGFTLAGIAFISWQAAILSLCGFIATGTPMIAGSLIRYFEAKEHLRREETKQHDNETNSPSRMA